MHDVLVSTGLPLIGIGHEGLQVFLRDSSGPAKYLRDALPDIDSHGPRGELFAISTGSLAAWLGSLRQELFRFGSSAI